MPRTWKAAIALGTVAAMAAVPATAREPARPTAAAPIEVRMVVVTAFEIGEDTGDKAGDLNHGPRRCLSSCRSRQDLGICATTRLARPC
jgi:hypothetical protein